MPRVSFTRDHVSCLLSLYLCENNLFELLHKISILKYIWKKNIYNFFENFYLYFYTDTKSQFYNDIETRILYLFK